MSLESDLVDIFTGPEITATEAAEQIAAAVVADTAAATAPGDMQTPSLLNDWVNYGGSFIDAGYYKLGDRVFLKGLVKDGVDVGIFALAAGFRPEDTAIFIAMSSSGTTRINVTGAGAVNINGTVPSWVSLDGISFRQTQ